MSDDRHERVRRVEDRHWWFVTLRELVAAEVARALPAGGRVLDVGCGTGGVLRAIASRYERVGVDLDPSAFGGEGVRDGIEFVQATVLALPFEDATFDLAISLDVLSDARVLDATAGAAEIARVLRPGGTVLLNLPAYAWLMSGHDVAARTGRRYTARRARALARAAGLEPLRSSYRVTVPFPAAAASRLLRRGSSGSDVGEVAEPLNRALLAIGRAENRFAARGLLPFGLSVFLVARRPGPAPSSISARPQAKPEPFARRLYARALRRRRLVALGQFAVTGERVPRRHRLLGEAVQAGHHGFVVDLGCGNAPLLRFIAPDRYVGVDGHAPSLDAGRRAHAGPGRTFVGAELTEVDLTPWRGADVVVLSSVTHHLPDAAVLRLLDRIVTEAAPGRILLQDAEATGPLGPLVTALDDGEHLRPRAELEALLAPRFGTRLLWTYDNPLRSFHQFLLEVRPRRA